MMNKNIPDWMKFVSQRRNSGSEHEKLYQTKSYKIAPRRNEVWI